MSNNVYGLDLGTCNLKIYCKSSGTVINEKNTIALVNKNQLYAYGDEAYAMYEKAPANIDVTFPVNKGVIADFNNMQAMIYELISKNGKTKGAEYIVAVPTAITEVEKKAFHDLFYKGKFKAKSVLLCEKPIADAVGLGLDVTEPTGIMVVDIGADTTEISVISLKGLVISDLLDFGGNRIDESISTYIKRNFNLLIGQKTSMLLKEHLASAKEGDVASEIVVGRDVVSGLPVEREITSDIIYNAIKENVNSICNSIKMVLEKTPPELARDIINSGIYLTGGSSKIYRFDELFSEMTNIKVNTCEKPEESVIMGLDKIVSDPKYTSLAYSLKNKVYK
ncbi:MAG: rod shape-determining protein [Eubacterium sp.]|nr:rod shape-determining protein [Eubacterium sp.]